MILQAARQVFADKSFARAEMEDIRRACGLSRGGLYHHFDNKQAILDALILTEIAALAQHLDAVSDPIPVLLGVGSTHLGAARGILDAMRGPEDLRAYLSGLDRAFDASLRPALQAALRAHVSEGTNPDHVADLFLVVTRHINQRTLLGNWSDAEAASFAATALLALAPLLRDPGGVQPLIARLAQEQGPA